jgi:hypothetical protein
MGNPKFKKGDLVNFKRNSIIKKNQESIVAVVEKTPNYNGEQIYIIEYSDGWTPNSIRVTQFGLNPEKKYLFVKESELN